MKTKYYILQGVRRAVACREWKRKTVPAIIVREGHQSVLRPRLSLALLYSPRSTVKLEDRFYRITPPIKHPITVELLGSRAQSALSVPLAKVRLV